MEGLMDLLQSDMGKQIINGVSSQTNASQQQTQSVLSMALPVLMGAMKRNAASPEGAEGLMGALSNKHDGSILDDVAGMVLNSGGNKKKGGLGGLLGGLFGGR